MNNIYGQECLFQTNEPDGCVSKKSKFGANFLGSNFASVLFKLLFESLLPSVMALKRSKAELLDLNVSTRAGPQSKKWSDQQITLNPTGSIHKKARKKKFDPKKVDFDEGDCT